MATVFAWSFLNPPTHQELTQEAVYNRFLPGAERSFADGKEIWICPSCRTPHCPSTNTLIDLPAFSCPCGVENPTSYYWKITNCAINNIPLDFKVYDQGETCTCTLFSSVAAIDCSRRIRGAQFGLIESGTLDYERFLARFENIESVSLNSEFPISHMYNQSNSVPIILEHVKKNGIPYVKGEHDVDGQYDIGGQSRLPCLRIQGYFVVDVRDIHLITRLMANGFPLIGDIPFGALFTFLNDGEIYYPPTVAAHHSVALIGSGIGINNGKSATFYVARDSYGFSHSSYHLQKYGADFLIWASSLRYVFGFYLDY